MMIRSLLYRTRTSNTIVCLSLQCARRRYASDVATTIPTPGNVVIITGASSGIGKEAAYKLAAKNSHVILATRSKEKTEPIIKDIIKSTGNNSVEFMELDTSSIRSVQKFVEEFKKRNLPLHILINNAGIAGKTGMSEDGYELQFATNYLGSFVLTTSLLNVIEQSAPARIIHVSSDAYRAVKDLDYKQLKEPDYSKPMSLRNYAYSKFCQVAFSNTLAKKMNSKNLKVYSMAVHPGFIASDIWRDRGNVFKWVVNRFGASSAKGAKGILNCALAPLESLQNGGFYDRLRLSPSTPQSNNAELQESLWRYGEAAVAECNKKNENHQN